MYKEFENDRMMRELHKLREEEYKTTKGLSFEERERHRMEGIKEGLEGTGYKLIDIKLGRFKIVKITD